MKVLYGSQDLWDIVDIGYSEPESENGLSAQQLNELRDARKKDKKALFFIYQSVDENIFERISGVSTAKAAWDALQNLYEGEEKVKLVRLQTLRAEFDTIRMKDSETIEEFFNRVLLIVNQLRSNGETIEDQRIVEKILRSMTRRYEHIVVAIEESKDLSTLSINSLMGSLQSHELRLKMFDSNPSEEAFHMQSSYRGRSNGRRGGRGGRGNGRSNVVTNTESESRDNQFFSNRGRGRSSNRGRGRSGGRGDFSHIQCFNCRRYGHFQADCWSKKTNSNQAETTLMHEQSNNDQGLLFLTLNVQESSTEEIWYLDSGCSNHMTGRKDIFISLDESHQNVVKTGDNKMLEVKGKGDILVKTKMGAKKITDVYYVSGLKHNLLSVGQLLLRGHDVIFKDNICEIRTKNGDLITKVRMTHNKMFPIKICYEKLVCFETLVNDTSWLWHCRFGHLSFDTLSHMCQQHMVRGMSNIKKEDQLCEACVFGKHHRNSFPTGGSWRASKPLELVHTDLCGPMRTTTHGGNRYFLTFIDDYSRKTWIYLLKEKSATFECFKTFKAMVENESNLKLKSLRSDRGGEYIVFADFLKENGIKHQKTVRRTPQQNGVAERKNRIIMELARSMLKAKKLPDQFWGDAVTCAVYLLNRASTKSVQGITPQEAWSGLKPTVSHLRVFGCIAYSHISDEKRGKLDDKSEKCIFVGYSENSKAYRLYNPISKKVIISRDVKFDEAKLWQWNAPNEDQNPLHVDMDGKKDARDLELEVTQPLTSPSSSHSTSDEETTPRKTRNIQEIYNTSRRILDEEHVDFALFANVDPVYFEEAIQDENWKDAMNQEIDAIRRNETWELVKLPENKKALGVKWIYRTKLKQNGEVQKYKARLVVKGYKQKFGVDYEEVFAPVTRLETVRLLLALAAKNNWKVHQMDVKSAFLNGYLEDEIYVEQPPGYAKIGEENKVCRLKKALYGLKQAPRAWYSRIDNFFLKDGFRRCPYEHALYTKEDENGNFLIICLYVDDLIFTGNSNMMIEEFRESMKKEFEMTDMGLLHYFLGIEVKQGDNEIAIFQKKYAKDLLKKFKMENAYPASTPMELGLKLSKHDVSEAFDATIYRSLVGSLMYLTTTRPDIMFSVSLLSRFMTSPKRSHWEAGKRVLRYILGTVDHGIHYKRNVDNVLVGYSDSDWGGNIDDFKSTSGYVFNIGSGAVSWASKKQDVVALSTTEAEYISLSVASCQALWLRNVLHELKCPQEKGTIMFCDNQSSISLSKNPVFHGRSKHINIKYHFIRELIKDGEVYIKYCKTQDQVADVFTKALKTDSFLKMKEKLGVWEV